MGGTPGFTALPTIASLYLLQRKLHSVTTLGSSAPVEDNGGVQDYVVDEREMPLRKGNGEGRVQMIRGPLLDHEHRFQRKCLDSDPFHQRS